MEDKSQGDRPFSSDAIQANEEVFSTFIFGHDVDMFYEETSLSAASLKNHHSSSSDLEVLKPEEFDIISRDIPMLTIRNDEPILSAQCPSSDEDIDGLSVYLDTGPGSPDFADVPEMPHDSDFTHKYQVSNYDTLSTSESIASDLFHVKISSSQPTSSQIEPVQRRRISSDSNVSLSMFRERPVDDVDKTWKEIMSHSIKEEIRCKIQLRRINTGQEELKVEFPEPTPTISFDAVKKRHEIRERNRMYAKQSRDRTRETRHMLQLENERLTEERGQLQNEVSMLKQQLSAVEKKFQTHAQTCPFIQQKEADRIHDIRTKSKKRFQKMWKPLSIISSIKNVRVGMTRKNVTLTGDEHVWVDGDTGFDTGKVTAMPYLPFSKTSRRVSENSSRYDLDKRKLSPPFGETSRLVSETSRLVSETSRLVSETSSRYDLDKRKLSPPFGETSRLVSETSRLVSETSSRYDLDKRKLAAYFGESSRRVSETFGQYDFERSIVDNSQEESKLYNLHHENTDTVLKVEIDKHLSRPLSAAASMVKFSDIKRLHKAEKNYKPAKS